MQGRRKLAPIGGGIVSCYEIKQLFNIPQNTISEIIGWPTHPAPPLPMGMMFSQTCFVSHPSGMPPLEYGDFNWNIFQETSYSLVCFSL